MKLLQLFILSLITISISAQEYEYEVFLEPLEIPALGGIQSYSHAEYNGEWLIIGGRLDGLHRRQPFAAFDAAGNNTQVIVVNPTSEQVWKASYSQLPSNIKEQLSSTNMQFHQEGNQLIITGGYAYSASANDHITFPYITTINIPQIIQEVKNNQITASSFIQKTDQKFAVTGGYLGKINDTYYLVGGHRFDGRYNPMGPTHGPGFEQEYTNEIRPFNLSFTASDFTVEHLPATHDAMHLHRRDYNLIPQIQNGNEALMVFSGVFQTTSNIPWLYPVEITSSGYQAIDTFTQYYNHYHCATLPIYNASKDEMHNIFFGGIAQFYRDNGVLVQDNDVPFVNTIADVSRTSNGEFKEQILSSSMPGFLGAGSEFIAKQNCPIYNNGVVIGDSISLAPIEVGYIFGGIQSTLPNIFFTNEGNQSTASNTIYKVTLSKKKITAVANKKSLDKSLLIYPNPAQDFVRIVIDLPSISDIEVEVYDSIGRLVGTQTIEKSKLIEGKNYIVLNKLNVKYGAYLYKIKVEGNVFTRKVIWTE